VTKPTATEPGRYPATDKPHAGAFSLTLPTLTFDMCPVFAAIEYERRRVVRFNATAHPTGRRMARQIAEAFPFDTALKYLIRDSNAK